MLTSVVSMMLFDPYRLIASSAAALISAEAIVKLVAPASARTSFDERDMMSVDEENRLPELISERMSIEWATKFAPTSMSNSPDE